MHLIGPRSALTHYPHPIHTCLHYISSYMIEDQVGLVGLKLLVGVDDLLIGSFLVLQPTQGIMLS